LNESQLADWHERALSIEIELGKTVLGQAHVIRMLTVAVFARGHVLLEGDVGVGKTTLLRAMAQMLGGGYERIEGTVDLMPGDLLYHTYVADDGRPRVEPGPLIRGGDALSVFFFNEINRARPQVHSTILRAMAERRANAFNREYELPHMLVFADRNRLEREETFELPSAARDRFLMEITVEIPEDPEVLRQLMFDTRFHNVDRLLGSLLSPLLSYSELNRVAEQIQRQIGASETLQRYAMNLVAATRDPGANGIRLSETDDGDLVRAGVSPRGMSMLMQAARVIAWLAGRDHVVPEDLQAVFRETVAHRIVFHPVYEMQRAHLLDDFMDQILAKVSAP